ncbi:MAG TPA: hypothetical protein VEW04_03055 [Allosphingosinicella sp.]|nr:hypothetical protein [Allosphingosinicella sp.]
MRGFQHLPLTWLAALGLLCAGCATTAPSGVTDAAGRSVSEALVINLAAGTATTARWTAETVDCSDQDVLCLAIPNRMALAFPRSCGALIGATRVSTRVGDLIEVAPAPHLAPPSGGYVVSAFPNVLLLYNINVGLTEARVVRHPPSDPDFDPNDHSERYFIRTSTGEGIFKCS